jgi:DNA-binding CsgD family transcriptional regulator
LWQEGQKWSFNEAIDAAMGFEYSHRAQKSAPMGPETEPSSAGADFDLTTREIEIARLLVAGKSTNEIADLLSISPRTVGTHVQNILAKLDVSTRAAAVAFLLRNGAV